MDKACFYDFLFLMKIPKHKSLIVLFMNENVRDSGHLQPPIIKFSVRCNVAKIQLLLFVPS